MAGGHEDFVEFRAVSPPTDRKFGLTVGAILIALAGARWTLSGASSLALALLGVGCVLILLGAIAPQLLKPANRAWMAMGALMAAILNPIVMLMMFGIIFVPVGLATRVFGRDILQRRPKPESESYWTECVPDEQVMQRLVDQF